MKQTNYSIILITETKVEEIAIINSKGLAYATLAKFEEIYKNNKNCKLTIKESKKKLNVIDKVLYYLNGEKF